jgi:hypothetical protein
MMHKKFAILMLCLPILTFTISCSAKYTQGSKYFIDQNDISDTDTSYSKIKVTRPFSWFKHMKCLGCILDFSISGSPESIIVIALDNDSGTIPLKRKANPDNTGLAGLYIQGNFIGLYPDPKIGRDDLFWTQKLAPSYVSVKNMVGDEEEKIITGLEYMNLVFANDGYVKSHYDYGKGKKGYIHVSANGNQYELGSLNMPERIYIRKVDIVGEIGLNEELSWYRKSGKSRIAFVLFCSEYRFSTIPITQYLPGYLYEYDIISSQYGVDWFDLTNKMRY